MNERAVFDAIAEFGPISCPAVAERTGISKPTVAQAVQAMVASGVVAHRGRSSGRSGRTGSLYGVCPQGGYSLCLDIGVGHVRAAVADLTGALVASVDRAAGLTSVARVLSSASAAVKLVLKRSQIGMGDVGAAVAGSPGAVDPRRRGLTHVGRLACLEGVDLGSRLGERLGIQFIVENDVNLAALGEQAAGHRNPNMAVLSVGLGVGAALILDGRLFRGPRGAAGEIESVPFGGVSWADGAVASSPRALARYIALRVSALAAIADVELVVLTGEFGLDASLLPPVRAIVGRYLSDPPRVETSSLGTSAVLLGGLAEANGLAVERILSTLSPTPPEPRL